MSHVRELDQYQDARRKLGRPSKTADKDTDNAAVAKVKAKAKAKQRGRGGQTGESGEADA